MNNKVTIFVIFGLILIGAAIVMSQFYVNRADRQYYLTNQDLADKQLLSDDEKSDLGLYHLAIYEDLGYDEEDNRQYALLGVREPEPIEYDVMSEEEKESLKIAKDTHVQVLLRGENGRPLQFRVLKSENDVVQLY